MIQDHQKPVHGFPGSRSHYQWPSMSRKPPVKKSLSIISVGGSTLDDLAYTLPTSVGSGWSSGIASGGSHRSGTVSEGWVWVRVNPGHRSGAMVLVRGQVANLYFASVVQIPTNGQNPTPVCNRMPQGIQCLLFGCLHFQILFASRSPGMEIQA